MKSFLLSLSLAAIVCAQSQATSGEGYYSYSGISPNSDYDQSISPSANTSTPWDLWTSIPNPPRWEWNIGIGVGTGNNSKVQTTYSISWPQVQGPDSLQEELFSANDTGFVNASSFCVTVVNSLFPTNVTNQFNPNGIGAASCGADFYNCYYAMLVAWRDSSRNATTGCLGDGVDPTTLPACRGSVESWNVETYNVWDEDLRNGETFFWRETVDGNGTLLEAERERMQMMILDYGRINEVVCARASEGNASIETGGVDDLTGDASSTGMMASWLMMAVIGIGAMWTML